MTAYSVPAERWQRATDVAVGHVASWRTTDLEDRGAEFYESLRALLLKAGSTEFEICLVAIYWAAVIISSTSADDERRQEQFELVSEHLARAEMSVTLKPQTGDYRVEFSGGPSVH